MNLLRSALLSASIAALAFTASAQTSMPAPVTDHGKSVDGKPLASPAATATTTLAGKTITINYNTPSIRGRKIMGELVPFDKVWRTGANPATTLITTGDLKIGKLTVPAGTHTIYTLPAAPGKPWLLIINNQTGQWGTVYKPEMDLGRTPMTSKPLTTPQELMSITFENVKAKTAELHVRWETTDEFVKISAK